jgi:hypothetical protein
VIYICGAMLGYTKCSRYYDCCPRCRYRIGELYRGSRMHRLSHSSPQLKLPLTDVDAGVSTGNDADLVLSFNNQVLQSLNDQVFALFFAGVTDLPEASFELKGTADVVANTPIGSVPISGIPFNVTSTLAGTSTQRPSCYIPLIISA